MLKREQHNLLKNEEPYRQWFNDAPVGLVSIDQDGIIVDCNDWIIEQSGLALHVVRGQNLFHLQNQGLATAVGEALRGLPSEYSGSFEGLSSGRVIYLHAVFKPTTCSEGSINGVVGAFWKGSLQQEKLSQIEERFNRRDLLAGLNNRIPFEAEMHRLDALGIYPVAIIIGDLDGLKSVNETLGAHVGDEYLRNWFQIVVDQGLDGAGIYRIGGDEMALVLPGYDRVQVQAVYSQLKVAFASFDTGNQLQLSVSMGYAVREMQSMDMMEVLKEADQHMCRQKLFHQQSGRSGIVNVVMQALQERDVVTGGHTGRIQDLVIMLADAMNFDDYRKQALILLARFHDIGKMGISDKILFKPAQLSASEFEEMKKHTEIGFRIARSASDLSYVADWILKHHERWDGTGYPVGLKGEEIPLECRILSVVDAYDAMVSDRPYRKAMPTGAAIAELKRGAGTQFDPKIVTIFLQAMQQLRQRRVAYL